MNLPPQWENVEGNLWRGPRPTGPDIISQFKTVINLEEGFFEFFHGEVGEERQWCKDAGVLFSHLPMSDWCAPAVGDLKDILKYAVSDMQKGPILVHCLHGNDRTGIVIAAYRILINGWTVEKAKNEMYAHGFHRFPYFFWVPVLDCLK